MRFDIESGSPTLGDTRGDSSQRRIVRGKTDRAAQRSRRRRSIDFDRRALGRRGFKRLPVQSRRRSECAERLVPVPDVVGEVRVGHVHERLDRRIGRASDRRQIVFK